MEVETMQSTAFTNLQAKYRRVTRPSWPSQQNAGGFFDVHPVGSLLRSLFLSSLLWVFLAFTIYTVYSYVVAAK
jgi:hypothetical protein